MNEDFRDFLKSLRGARTRFVVVGAHALAAHGAPRATGDLDIFIECSAENAARAWAAIVAFGAPTKTLGIAQTDLAAPGIIVQIGMPPRRIDIMTRISGIGFAEVWTSRIELDIDGSPVPLIGREALITNKLAAGRPQDLADVEALRAID